MSALRRSARPGAPLTRREKERGITVEVEALVAGVVAALLGAGFALIVFGGTSVPIWADWDWNHWSIGMVAVVSVSVLGTVSAVIGYWRSRRLPGQQWRLELPSWKFTLDAIVVAVVHTALGALATAILMFVVQLAFRRLSIDHIDAAIGCAIATGFAAYILYLAVSKLTTVSLSQRMFLFVGVGILASMATSTDPIWWRYHISHLGALGDRPSISFNAVLIVAGVLVTTFALYVDRDIRNLHDAGVIRYRWSPPVVSALFIAMGLALAGIGFVPVNVSVVIHNSFAIALTVFFGILMLVSPLLLRGMPWQFFLATLGFLAVLVLATWLYHGIGYLPLTSFELIAFGVLFGWISMFVRFLAALLETHAQSQAQLPGIVAPVGQVAEVDSDRTVMQGQKDARPATEPRQEPAETTEDKVDVMPLPDNVPPRPPLPTPHDTGLTR